MSTTQAQWLSRFRRHLGDPNANIWTDYDLIDITAMAYEQAWPDWYLEVRDDTSYTGYASLPPGTLSVPVPTAFIGGKIYNIFGRTNRYQQGTAFTTPASSSVFTTTVAHNLSVGQQVQLNGSSLPGALSYWDVYYVKTVPTSLTFTLSLTNGGAAVFSTTAGSGYVGVYIDPTNDRTPFNQWTRGIRIDPLTSDSPRIRFTKRDSIPFEIRIEGASVLAYPYQTLTANGTDTFTAATGYTPFNGDTMYFYAVAPTSFSTGSLTGVGGKTPYYVVNTAGQTFKLSATSGGAAISTTSSGTYNIYPGSQVLPGTDSTWLLTFLRGQGEIEARSEKQRSGNLDRRAMAQRRLLAQQDIIEARKHRMQPHISSMFTWDG